MKDKNKKECVFLSRGEIHIHSDKSLSIHLMEHDNRLKDISRLLNQRKLKIATIDPKLAGGTGFYRGNWYLIPDLEYTGCCNYGGYAHFSFSYEFGGGTYNWEKEGVRMLKTEEIDKIRTKQAL